MKRIIGLIENRQAFLWMGFVLLLVVCPAQAKISDHISGSYFVSDVTAQGPSVRLTMHIHLLNGTDSDLTNSKIFFLHPRWKAMIEGANPSVILHPHSSTDATLDLLVPHQEYEMWRKGARPLLSLQLPSNTHAETSIMVQLHRTRALEVK